MIEIINEQLRIKACNIGDLTMKETSDFLKLWNDNSPISLLTIFRDEENFIVINKDRRDYDIIKSLTESYINGTVEERKILIERHPKCKGEFLLIDATLEERKMEEITKLLKLNSTCNSETIDILQGIINKFGINFFTIRQAFELGVIQGKRKERAKKACYN